MHNNIMAAGSRDRLPMLAMRRYAQWRSRFLRYIDTRPNGDALRKCIFEAGSRDRLPMLAMRRYAQWRSRFLRYIDTRPNGDALRKCIFEGLYTLSTIVFPAIPVMENSPAVPEHTTVETL
nr:hypothetical protein [Tanacetum cinerariifolium]